MLDQSFDLSNINDQTACNLCFSIFPGAETILHKLAKGNSSNAKDQILVVNLTTKLFEKCEGGTEEEILGMEKKTPLKIPILEDWYGITPLDYALGSPAQEGFVGIFNEKKDTPKKASSLSGGEQSVNQETVNISMAAIIF